MRVEVKAASICDTERNIALAYLSDLSLLCLERPFPMGSEV